jgi:UDP-N-acetylglucosamine 1-carboxyvinyltransferase
LSKYIIWPGGPLTGEVRVSVSKNAVLPILAATLLTDEPCTIRDIPLINDVQTMLELLKSFGSKIEFVDNVLTIHPGHTDYETSYEWVQKMRASVLVLGPLLARVGKARISLPGGCAIGTRPIDLHIKGMQLLGADVKMSAGFVEASCARLSGGLVYLDFPSVGATENVMMAACLAAGETRIENAAKEPEIIDLAHFLNAMGANITGAGNSTIFIEGVKRLNRVDYRPIADRIEAGTLLISTAACGGNVLIRGAVPEHLRSVIAKLKECGAQIEEYPTGIRLKSDGKLHAADIKTMAYPGFPTDLQAPMMALLASCSGTSLVIESIFENRYMHVNELRRMGANIRLDERTAVIEGGCMHGAQVTASDLRAGAALVIAALCSKDGVSQIEGISHIERGYEGLDEKLRGIGANIQKV